MDWADDDCNSCILAAAGGGQEQEGASGIVGSIVARASDCWCFGCFIRCESGAFAGSGGSRNHATASNSRCW